MKKTIIAFACILATFSAFLSCQKNIQTIKSGHWRGVFIIPGNEIPFEFDVKGTNPDNLSVELINGSDRFVLKKVEIRNDSAFIPIDLYDAVLKAKIDQNSLHGRFIKLNTEKPDTGIFFKAEFGDIPRFIGSGLKPEFSMDGTWDVVFGEGAEAKNNVGNFIQTDANLNGSILTPSGDMRFLDGIIQGKSFALSAFGGSTPYLLKGEFNTDSTFSGQFITPRRTTPIYGKLNSKAALPDAYAASKLKPGFSTFNFTFPNLDGKSISLSDEKFNGKVVIITILGSWCPNCLDENAFLAEWFKANKNRGVEIIGLGFERKNDFEAAKKSLSALKSRLDIQYEILFAGQASPESVLKALPELESFSAFPTTIFIDKKGYVRKIHSGFNGPATGKFHDEFKAEFKQLTDELLAE